MSETVTIILENPGVLAFASLFKQKKQYKENPNDPDRFAYEATFIYSEAKLLADLSKACKKFAKEAWPNLPIESIEFPFNRNEIKVNQTTGERYNGFADGGIHFVARAFKPENAPACRYKRQSITEDPKNEIFYAGAIVRPALQIYKPKTAKRVCLGLSGVMFVAHGDRLVAGGASSIDIFDKYSKEEESLESLDAKDEAAILAGGEASGKPSDQKVVDNWGGENAPNEDDDDDGVPL